MAAFHLIIYGRFWVITEDSMARILHVRKSEIRSWIEKGWLEATVWSKQQ